MQIKRMRSLADTEVRFDFPVTAIVGPNGGGKSTVLGAAACAYKDVAPKRFFAKSGKLDDSMANWQSEYELVDKRSAPKALCNARRHLKPKGGAARDSTAKC
ncbi:AAA family ATPase [Pseudonocardia sp. NPDC046786]|uniref:ATP-binding protein n=1 Tax=Pseudonocardia sp. NPDC046786 TaxID=3155471 RepID=UPI0033C22D9C